ncbi:MAG: zinc ribbon domain-containing protein [bacterium]
MNVIGRGESAWTGAYFRVAQPTEAREAAEAERRFAGDDEALVAVYLKHGLLIDTYPALKRLYERTDDPQRKQRLQYYLQAAGLLNCATCGFRVTAEKSKGHIYYHCNNRTGTCTKRGIREEVLEGRIDALLEDITVYPEYERLALEILDDMRQEALSSRQAIFESRQQALADLKRQKDALLGIFLQGHITDDEFAAKKTELVKLDGAVNLKGEDSEEELNGVWQTAASAVSFMAQTRIQFHTGGCGQQALCGGTLG